jgi:hypothetical protein
MSFPGISARSPSCRCTGIQATLLHRPQGEIKHRINRGKNRNCCKEIGGRGERDIIWGLDNPGLDGFGSVAVPLPVRQALHHGVELSLSGGGGGGG